MKFTHDTPPSPDGDAHRQGVSKPGQKGTATATTTSDFFDAQPSQKPYLDNDIFRRVDFVAAWGIDVWASLATIIRAQSLALLSECIENVHYNGPIGAINLGAGCDHRPDQAINEKRRQCF